MSVLLFSFVMVAGAVAIVLNGEDKCNNTRTQSYPSGLQLKRELRNTINYNHDIYNINFDLIEDYIFRDYVYDYEKNHGYTREIALRKALDKYIKLFGNIKN